MLQFTNNAASRPRYIARRRRRAERRRRRRAISLLEILVAIFILSIGLLGVASLIPVGNSEVIKASIAHRSAETGLRAFREMKLRGYLSPQNWLFGATPVIDEETGVMLPDVNGRTLVIDPLTSLTGNTQAIPNVKMLTLRSAPATENSKASAMSSPVAERVFVGQDNLQFERPREQTKPPEQFLQSGRGSRRRTNPLYSWMAMLTPMQVLPDGTLAPEFRLDTYLMSVIVFYRDLPSAKPRTALQMTAEPLGGNEFRFRMESDEADEDARKFLRPRRWVLLTDGARQFRWYRIGSVEGSVAEDRNDRVVSLMGPDWDAQSGQTPTAIVFESVVTVIEKMVQLEGQTMWSPGAAPASTSK